MKKNIRYGYSLISKWLYDNEKNKPIYIEYNVVIEIIFCI